MAIIKREKAIFLDIDGVLNTTASLTDGIELLAEKVIILREVVDATNAGIVLSTSWRDMWSREQFEAMFSVTGFPLIPLMGVTPSYMDQPRGKEIRSWWAQNDKCTNYIILDDDTDMLDEQLPYFYNTIDSVGLVRREIPDMIECLNTGNPINSESEIEQLKDKRNEDWSSIYPALFA